jgi:hypothetical protein
MQDMNFYEEKELSDVSVSELQEMIKVLFEKRKTVEDQEKITKELNAEVDALKQKVLGILEAHNLDNFNASGVGSVYRTAKMQVSYPKDPEQAAKFRQYLIDNGMESMLTLNHQTLNAFYKSKVSEAESQGLPIADVLPGVGEPSVYVTIGMRKGK